MFGVEKLIEEIAGEVWCKTAIFMCILGLKSPRWGQKSIFLVETRLHHQESSKKKITFGYGGELTIFKFSP